METFYDRVEQIAEHYEMKITTLLSRCDVPYSTFRSARFRRNDPHLQTILKVLRTCPRVRWEWLVEGKGDMLAPEGPKPEDEHAEITRLKKQIERLTAIILEKEKRIIELEMEQEARQ